MDICVIPSINIAIISGGNSCVNKLIILQIGYATNALSTKYIVEIPNEKIDTIKANFGVTFRNITTKQVNKRTIIRKLRGLMCVLIK